MPGSPAVRLAALAVAAAAALAPAAAAAERMAGPASPPPLTWLRGEGNYTKASRSARHIDRIVIHSTEGGFRGSVSWLQNPRARASAHFVVARDGGVVQLVHLSDVAWHSGNRKMNRRSIGIELVGWAGDPRGFTEAQYLAAARLGAWLSTRYGFPLERTHLVEHAEVPDPLVRGRFGGRSNHADPGRYWRWDRYLALARTIAARGRPQPVRVEPVALADGQLLSGRLPWRAAVTDGAHAVEFVVDGRLRWRDAVAPFAYAGGRGLDTLGLTNGSHRLELRAYWSGGRHDTRWVDVRVLNRPFRITWAGARRWSVERGVVRLGVRPRNAPARAVWLRVDGRRVATDRRAPYRFRWDTRARRNGRHVLEVVARAQDGRVVRHRFSVVVRNRR
ncbi:MAG TPA: N-acetylmuramoyl-L-alanine amidase [Gaiellaceae bacterium]|nr:N-acetylmuramoyl-L-alanine amidase [Gaiellaceae bacterium]